jgi:hypothetical protein
MGRSGRQKEVHAQGLSDGQPALDEMAKAWTAGSRAQALRRFTAQGRRGPLALRFKQDGVGRLIEPYPE